MNTEPPTPGDKRDRRATLVRLWLQRNTGAGKKGRFTFTGIGRALGLPSNAIQRAVYDLRDHYHDTPVIVSTPTYRNQYVVEVGWRSAAQYGLANNLRHRATRAISDAVLMERAAAVETNPAMAYVYRNEAAESRNEARRLRSLAEMVTAEAETSEAGE